MVYARMIREASRSTPQTLLELGSGGGNNASHMKKHFRMTLTDLSPRMLALSRTINPECEHITGDMRTLRLRRHFDAVFVHDAICYMRTKPDLLAAMRTVAAHLRPGGIALFAPDDFRDTFRARTAHGGHDAKDTQQGMRFVEWVHDPDPSGSAYAIDYVYLLRNGASLTLGSDRHVHGLFSRAEWRAALRSCGFSVVRMERPAGCSHVILVRKRGQGRGRQPRVRGRSGRKQVTQRAAR
ncbi:MAG: class I SAM-dependent methyltransferase [Candidatus Eremiobacteraeota bacterium]|nr:class I SAM-dependent methyltransferase [Candidatus Eremiobacteraeota bacterium]